MKRLCLSGTFHSGNRGDAAIQTSALCELRARFPEAGITLLSCSPGDDAHIYPDTELVLSSRRKPRRALLTLAAALARRVLRVPRALLPAEVRAIDKADLLLDFSGDGFTGTFGWKCPASHAVPLLLARVLGTPYALVGQTIGPFSGGNTFYRRLFNGARAVLCRDQESCDRMSELGVSPSLVELTADPAFLLPPAPAGEVARVYPHLDTFLDGRPVLGVTPSNLHNILAVRNGEEVLEALAAACRRLIEEQGCRVLIIPTVFGPGEEYDDRTASHLLLERLPEGTAFVCGEPLGPRQLKALLGRCDLFLGLRMHALILALSQSVPCLAIAYAPKTAHLFQRIGHPDLCIPAEAIPQADLPSRAAELWSERRGLALDLRTRILPELLASARRNFERICAGH